MKDEGVYQRRNLCRCMVIAGTMTAKTEKIKEKGQQLRFQAVAFFNFEILFFCHFVVNQPCQNGYQLGYTYDDDHGDIPIAAAVKGVKIAPASVFLADKDHLCQINRAV